MNSPVANVILLAGVLAVSTLLMGTYAGVVAAIAIKVVGWLL